MNANESVKGAFICNLPCLVKVREESFSNFWGICRANDVVDIVSQNNLLSPRAFIDIDSVISGKLSERSEHWLVVSLAYLHIVIHS